MAIKLCLVISRRVELQHKVTGKDFCSTLKGAVHEKTQNDNDDDDVDDDVNDDDDDNVHSFILLRVP